MVDGDVKSPRFDLLGLPCVIYEEYSYLFFPFFFYFGFRDDDSI